MTRGAPVRERCERVSIATGSLRDGREEVANQGSRPTVLERAIDQNVSYKRTERASVRCIDFRQVNERTCIPRANPEPCCGAADTAQRFSNSLERPLSRRRHSTSQSSCRRPPERFPEGD